MKSKIDYKELIKLIDLMEERNLVDFELEVEGLKIKVSKDQLPANTKENRSLAELNPVHEIMQAGITPESEAPENDSGLHIITSPMVGTFYRAPDPTSAPFVERGEPVKKSQTLCIIEAMKLMNEIEADIDGVLEKIYIKSGKAVEYGQKLFAIRVQN
jgi:acetyl-CoA carboxylase biotin carboxyl carrier protein